MARADPFARYAVLGAIGFVGWNWASAQPSGTWPRSMIDQARGFLSHPTLPGVLPSSTAPRTTAPPPRTPTQGGFGPPVPPAQQITIPDGQAMIATSLVDLGGFPLVLDPNQDALRQDPAMGGTNVYAPGDIVVNAADGVQWQILAGRGGVLLAGPGGAVAASDDFRV